MRLPESDAEALAPTAPRPGELVQAVAPAGIFDEQAFRRGVARLQEHYRVRFDPDITGRNGFLAGDDERRCRELVSALQDTEVKALVAVRGGYGATRLLDRIDPALVAGNPKPLVGFSDVTALHALWARAGVRSLHATMLALLGDRPGPLFDRWLAALAGATPEPLTGLHPISGGSATGALVGGNLSILAALLGTDHEPPLRGRVLFLEDTDERPYRVDRMLTSLSQAGWFRQVYGVILGAFNRTPTGPDGVTVEQVLAERLGNLGLPVVSGVPAGHISDNLELPLGARVRLDADAGALEFLEPATTRTRG